MPTNTAAKHTPPTLFIGPYIEYGEGKRNLSGEIATIQVDGPAHVLVVSLGADKAEVVQLRDSIVRAVNCHDELVAALRSACDAMLEHDGFSADPTNYAGWEEKENYEVHMRCVDILAKVQA